MAEQDQKNRTILIIEDEVPLGDLLADAMHQNGLLTIQAVDGEDGLKKALQGHPDLILLNILLPKLDGMTVLKKLREDSRGVGIPVIILTNVDPDIKQLKDIETYKASYCLIKAQTKMEYIVIKVQELLSAHP